jgi:hypothetical protein
MRRFRLFPVSTPRSGRGRRRLPAWLGWPAALWLLPAGLALGEWPQDAQWSTVRCVQSDPSANQVPLSGPSNAAAERPGTEPPRLKSIHEIHADIRSTREPSQPHPDDDNYAARFFSNEPYIDSRSSAMPTGLHYSLYSPASNVCHSPVYFRQERVEDYGRYTPLAEPVVSGIEFYANVLLFPLKALARPPWRCECD